MMSMASISHPEGRGGDARWEQGDICFKHTPAFTSAFTKSPRLCPQIKTCRQAQPPACWFPPIFLVCLWCLWCIASSLNCPDFFFFFMTHLMGKWHLIAPESWSSLILEIQIVSLASSDKPHWLLLCCHWACALAPPSLLVCRCCSGDYSFGEALKSTVGRCSWAQRQDKMVAVVVVKGLAAKCKCRGGGAVLPRTHSLPLSFSVSVSSSFHGWRSGLIIDQPPLTIRRLWVVNVHAGSNPPPSPWHYSRYTK